MKVFKAEQIRLLDIATIEKEPIESVNLMERAASGLFNWIINKYTNQNKFFIFCGRGNNGGDGLALARMLIEKSYYCEVFLLNEKEDLSNDSKINLARLKNINPNIIQTLKSEIDFPNISENSIIIDAIFGSGINRSVSGFEGDIIKNINATDSTKIAIDIPSGLFAEDNSNNKGEIIKADYTLSFETPFLSFFFPENNIYTGEWNIIKINLHEETKKQTFSPYHFVEISDIQQIIKPRFKFAHKGNFGHALLVSGSKGKTGAAVLSAQSCLRSGCGLLSCHIPSSSYTIMQTACPEAMVKLDENPDYISKLENIEKYSAIGIGPGIGTNTKTANALKNLIETYEKPMVLDADALNIIAENKYLLEKFKAKSILTPHLGEFKRLFGDFDNLYQALEIQIEASKKYNLIIVRKGAYTAITLPDGSCYFNSTGNPGMATAGSGDILTGIILSLLSQGYKPEDAAIAGVFIHGLSGDITLNKESYESIIASDITKNLGTAFKQIYNYE